MGREASRGLYGAGEGTLAGLRREREVYEGVIPADGGHSLGEPEWAGGHRPGQPLALE